MAVMVQASGTLDTSGLVLGGFGNTDDPTDIVGGGGGDDPQGYWVGVKGDGSELDLVLHHRAGEDNMATDVLLDGITLDETYLVIIKSIVNGGGGSAEALSVWVNPTDVSSEAALGTAVSGLSTDQSLFGTAFTQLSFYGDSLEMVVRFDELSLGTALSDVVTTVTPPAGTIMIFR
ncbi:MAG: hypothetical protein HN383_15970 [Verrucomicrobia bacterium]|nr:hypothetical protein [Verrucomicrobiota bacterium]